MICSQFGYTRQAWYQHLKLAERREKLYALVMESVRSIKATQPLAGLRKLHEMLLTGRDCVKVKIGRDALLELLHKHKYIKKKKDKSYSTTNSRHTLQTYPNLVKGLVISSVNQVWVSDITYIRTGHGFCYLSLVSDLYSRKIIGYKLAHNLEAEHTLAAFQQAYAFALPASGLIHHSDKGIQYCCKKYISKLQKSGLIISMTGPDRCFDNAVAERINGTLKRELGLGDTIPNFRTAQKIVDEAVSIYNKHRLHTALKYKTPDQVYFNSLLGNVS